MEASPTGNPTMSRRVQRSKGDGQALRPRQATGASNTRPCNYTPAHQHAQPATPRSAWRLPIIRRAPLVDTGSAGSELAKKEEPARQARGRQWVQDNKRPSNNGNNRQTVFEPNLSGIARCPRAILEPPAEIRSPDTRTKRQAPSLAAIAWLVVITCQLADRRTCLSLISGAGYEFGALAGFERLQWPIVLCAEALQSAPTATAAPIIKASQLAIDNNNNNETKTTITQTPAPQLNESTTLVGHSDTGHKHDALANDINKHRHAGKGHGGPANVLCNSRCRCVLMEPLQPAPPVGQSNDTKPSTNSSISPLAAFVEDYEQEDEDDDSAAASPDEPVEDEPLPRGLLMGGAELSANPELSVTGSSAPKKSSTNPDMRQMFRLGAHLPQDRQPHPAPIGGPGRQQVAAVQLYAQAFHSNHQAPSPPQTPLKLSPFLSSAHQVAGPLDPPVSPVKRIKTRGPMPVSTGGGTGPGAARWPPLPVNVNLVELRSLDASGRFSQYSLELETRSNGTRRPSDSLVNSTKRLLQELEATPIMEPEALILRANNMSFELWCELYALLAPHFRRLVYQLDLSHNALPKLGLTFTGFIEHQLVALNGSWPSNQNQPQSATRTGNGPTLAGTLPMPARPKQLLSSGLLYELVIGQTNLTQLYHQDPSQPASESKPPSQSNKLVVQETARSVKSQILTQPIQIRALDLSHNKIKWLINDQFRALKHVQSIRLDHNRIRYIHRHAFSGLESLRYLNLNSNRLQVIYTEQFQTNYKLLAIRLRNNYLAYLRGGSFTSLSNLKRLDVSQNKLTLVSANAFVGLESLVHLNCSSNQFLQVPSTSLHPLISLRQLDFSNNLLGQLMPGAFFHLPIVELLLQNNSQLSDIERGAFWDLPYLRQLRLNGNPSLANINSQAFVGTPNICVIEAEQCPLLDPETRQLLDNITTASEMRLLRLEMLRTTDSTVGDRQLLNATTTNQQASPSNLDRSSESGEGVQRELTPAHLLAVVAPSAGLANQKYLYFLACVAFLAIVVKLLFKYTASNRYLTSVRQRRRVYEANTELAELSLALPSLDHQQHSLYLDGLPSVISSASSLATAPTSVLCPDVQQLDHCEHEPVSQLTAQSVDISVISDSMCDYSQEQDQPLQMQMHHSSGQCPLPGCQGSSLNENNMLDSSCLSARQQGEETSEEPQVRAGSSSALDLIHSQLVAAGYECGHANCAHFYQSLGPAIQLADLAAVSDYC